MFPAASALAGDVWGTGDLAELQGGEQREGPAALMGWAGDGWRELRRGGVPPAAGSGPKSTAGQGHKL